MDNENILWQTLVRCFDNTASPEERARMEAYMAESGDNRRQIEQLTDILLAAETLAQMRAVDTAAAKRKFRRRIASRRRRNLFTLVSRAAAVLFVPLAVAVAVLVCGRMNRPAEEVRTVELRSAAGMVSTTTLPDGTQVWLNSCSVLTYPSQFGEERSVTLCGQGYFKVAKDAAHPFKVDAGGVTITVTGTEFDVDAYDDSGRSVRAMLVEGGIDLSYRAPDNTLRTIALAPDQRAAVDREAGTVSVQTVDAASLVAWREGRIVLDHTPFEDALRMIENRFDVRFDVRNRALFEHTFTGIFVDQRLDTILNHFSLSSRISFSRETDGSSALREGRETITVY